MKVSKNVLDTAEALRRANREGKKKPKITFEVVKFGEDNGFSRVETVIIVHGAETLQNVKMPKGIKIADITVKCRGVDSPIIINNVKSRYRNFIYINLSQDIEHLSEFSKRVPVSVK